MKSFLFVSLLLMESLAGLIFAQDLSEVQKRQFNLAVLRTMEQYELRSSMYGDSKFSFIQLFDSPHTMIFNDLLGLSDDSLLSVAHYAELLSKCKSQSVTLKNIKKGRFFSKDGQWYLEVNFQKQIGYWKSFSKKYNAKYSSQKYYGQDYQMKAIILCDSIPAQCKIVSLEGSMPSGKKPIPVAHKVLQKTKDERDSGLVCDGEKVKFYAGQAYLPLNSRLSYPADEDIRIIEQSVDTTGYRNPFNISMFSVRYLSKILRLKLHYDLGFGQTYKVESNADQIDNSSKCHQLGIDFGYFFYDHSKLKIGAYLGAGISVSQLDCSLENYSYHYQTFGEADIDGDSYIRYYNFKRISHAIKSSDIVIPLYFELEYKFRPKWLMYANLGVKSYLNISTKRTDLSAIYSTYGIYPDYNNLKLDAMAIPDYQQFVTDGQLKLKGSESSDVDFQTVSLDVFGGVGVRYRLMKSQPLYADLGISFQKSAISPYETNALTLSIGECGETKTLSEYTVLEGEKTRSLSDYMSTIRRQSLSINIGVNYKF